MEEAKQTQGLEKNFLESIASIPELNFGTLQYQEVEGPGCAVLSLGDVPPKAFAKYVSDMAEMGYICQERHCLGSGSFYAFVRGDSALFLNYYPEIRQMRFVGEQNSRYYRLQDRLGGWQLPSLLTQIDLEDHGMSYLLRLSDGRFLILDGGRGWDPEADKLMRQLKSQSPDEKPVIAAWIFTHPHIDHYPCFLTFYEKYRDQVVIQAFLYNFPELTEEAIARNPKILEKGEKEYLERMEQYVTEHGALVVRPHTGQVYQFANVRMEVLASLDDTAFYPCGVNAFSLVLRMFIEGQSILFCADSQLEQAALAERYGTYLKSDILQVTHHGFDGGTTRCYSLVSPSVCLAPVEEELFYGYMSPYYEANKTLIYDLDVQEIRTGSNGDQVLTLPYHAKPNGKYQLFEKAREWQKKLGARSWVFADLTWDTCKFSLLNATFFEGVVSADLYFENPADTIRSIKITVPACTVKRVDFADESCIDGDALYFNPSSLKKMGIPEGKTFTVHFLSDRPMVIWGKLEPVYTY